MVRRAGTQGSRHDVFRAFRQVLEQAARWRWIERNPARDVKNPRPKRPEVAPFASWDEVEAVAAELDPRYAAIPVFAAGTGLRPEEWIALERRDVDRQAAVVTVERVYSQGRLKACAKSSRQRRRVPLRTRVLDALEALPARLDSPLLFPAARGGYIDLEKFRARHWAPAIRASGVAHHRIYDLRHFYATTSLAAGVSLFTLSPPDGHIARDDRPDLRAPSPGRRGARASAARRLRLGFSGRRCVDVECEPDLTGACCLRPARLEPNDLVPRHNDARLVGFAETHEGDPLAMNLHVRDLVLLAVSELDAYTRDLEPVLAPERIDGYGERAAT